jgi:hypothetical protein
MFSILLVLLIAGSDFFPSCVISWYHFSLTLYSHFSTNYNFLVFTLPSHRPVDVVLAFLSGQSASGTDSALRQLGMEIMRERDELGLFLDFVAMALPLRTNFELVQAYLALFLKIHAEVVAAHPSLQAKVAALRAQQRAAWRTLEELFQRNMCLVQYLSNVM